MLFREEKSYGLHRSYKRLGKIPCGKYFRYLLVCDVTFTLCCLKLTKKKGQVIDVQGSHEAYYTATDLLMLTKLHEATKARQLI